MSVSTNVVGIHTPRLIWLALAAFIAGGVAILSAAPAAASGPTCSDFGWTNHGQHIVGDYVVGGGVDWPPAGGVGSEIAGNGALAPGAPGIHQHADPDGNAVKPGASFCTDSSSPTADDLPDQAGR